MLRFAAAGALALVLAASCLSGEPALAQTSATLSVKDATGTTRNLCETADGSGNLTPCLQAGAATQAGQTQLHTDLNPTGGLATASGQATIAANTKPVTSFGAVTVGTAFTPGLGIAAVCTASGNVVLAGSDGSQITVPVGVGFNQFGFGVSNVVSQTSTCTFTALR